jgi:hypothetical protein
MEFERGEAATIIRMDKKLMWTLLPAQKQYMEHRFSEQAPEKRQKGDYRDCDVKQSEIGRETIEGFATRKMTMEMSCPGDEKHTGTIWLTKRTSHTKGGGLPAGSKKDAVRIELKTLKSEAGPQTVEIPDGYTKMEIPSLGTSGR